MFFCRWTLQMPGSLHTDYPTRRYQNLSKKIRILSPKNGGCRSRKGTSVEKTPVFDVFRKSLSYRWLRRFLSVNGRFTKDEFAKGKVSLRQRPCFVVWKVMFHATKHDLWCSQSLCFAVRKLVFHKMKNEEWRVKNQLLHFLTSISPLFPDNFLSIYLTTNRLQNKGETSSELSAFDLEYTRVH